MGELRIQRTIRLEWKKKATYPKTWCENCRNIYVLRSTNVRGYGICPKCRSTSKNPILYQSTLNHLEWKKLYEKFCRMDLYNVAYCERCANIWKLQRSKLWKPTQCARCRFFRGNGNEFVMAFKERYDNDVENKIYSLCIKKFKHDKRFLRYEQRESLRLQWKQKLLEEVSKQN